MLEVRTMYDGKYDCVVKLGKYSNNGNLAIQLVTPYEPFATLTVNLDDLKGEAYGYVDTNNCPWAESLIKEYGLGEDTGFSRNSGWCTYPLYKFNLEELKKHEYFPDDYVPHDDDMPF